MLKISVIIPVYNVEKYLSQCVDSILAQTYKNIEIILVDDGSTDSCPEKCDSYAKTDSRIITIHKKNGGPSEARNKGLESATGDYVLFVDSDDYLNDINAVQKIVDNLEQNPVDVLISGIKKYYQADNRFEKISEKLNNSNNISIESLMKNNCFIASQCDKVVSLKLIKSNNIYFTAGQLSEDIEYCIKLLIHANSFNILNESFYVYRKQNKDSITANLSYKNMSDIADTIKKYSEIYSNNKQEKSLYVLNFLALQYIIFLAMSNKLKSNEVKILVNDMKKYWYLLNYNLYPYVKTVNYLKFTGYNSIVKLLGIYKKIKEFTERLWI